MGDLGLVGCVDIGVRSGYFWHDNAGILADPTFRPDRRRGRRTRAFGHHAAAHIDGVETVAGAKARWLGHELHAEVAIVVDDAMSVSRANKIVAALESELFAHLPALKSASVRFAAPVSEDAAAPHQGHHHAPDPVLVVDELAQGVLEIIDTDAGERMRLTTRRAAELLEAVVTISRPDGPETLVLQRVAGDVNVFLSTATPAEPHEFDAILTLSAGTKTSSLPFHMAEPRGSSLTAAFDKFTGDNDPYGEHDFGSVEVGGNGVFWKIDCYDLALTNHSPDPTDPSVTARVMTVMLAEEY